MGSVIGQGKLLLRKAFIASRSDVDVRNAWVRVARTSLATET
jgi:hypothetical protein